MLYRKESSGDIKGEDAKFTLLSRGLDVLEIDGERKLVIALEDSNNPAGDPLYIIPDTTHLSKCIRKNAPHAMEFEPDCDLIECLRSAASATEKLIKSDDFINADDIEQQQRMFDEEEAIDKVMSKLVYTFDNLYQGYQIRCTAKKCWAIPVDVYKSYSSKDIAISITFLLGVFEYAHQIGRRRAEYSSYTIDPSRPIYLHPTRKSQTELGQKQIKCEVLNALMSPVAAPSCFYAVKLPQYPPMDALKLDLAPVKSAMPR